MSTLIAQADEWLLVKPTFAELVGAAADREIERREREQESAGRHLRAYMDGQIELYRERLEKIAGPDLITDLGLVIHFAPLCLEGCPYGEILHSGHRVYLTRGQTGQWFAVPAALDELDETQRIAVPITLGPDLPTNYDRIVLALARALQEAAP